MTEQSAEQLFRQTLADTLASVRAGTNPEHAVPSNAETGRDGQGDKIHSEGGDTGDPKPLHPNHETAADVNSNSGPNFDANVGADPGKGSNDIESRAAGHGITQSTVDARNPDVHVAESTDTAVEKKPEKGKQETELLTDTMIDRQNFCYPNPMHAVRALTDPEAVRATITTESTARVGNDDTKGTEKNRKLRYEADGGINNLGPIAHLDTQPDSRPDPNLEPYPDPRRTLTYPAELKPNLTPDPGSDAIFNRKSKPDLEPEMECFSDSGTDSKANYASNFSAPGISVSTAEADINKTTAAGINETAEAKISQTAEPNSGPKADKIEDTNPDTNTELISNANVDSAETNADLKPASTSRPNISDVPINISTEVVSSTAAGSRQNPNTGKRRGSAARIKTPRKAAKPATKGKL